MKLYVHVKRITLVKLNAMLKFDRKNIQTLTKYLNHLDIETRTQRIHLHGTF